MLSIVVCGFAHRLYTRANMPHGLPHEGETLCGVGIERFVETSNRVPE
jgi:hypothetical protein